VRERERERFLETSKALTQFSLEILKGRDPLKDVHAHWRILDHKEIGLEGVDCIHPAQDRDWWQALVHMVMSLRFYKSREFLE
jgi:hypothetical protein